MSHMRLKVDREVQSQVLGWTINVMWWAVLWPYELCSAVFGRAKAKALLKRLLGRPVVPETRGRA